MRRPPLPSGRHTEVKKQFHEKTGAALARLVVDPLPAAAASSSNARLSMGFCIAPMGSGLGPSDPFGITFLGSSIFSHTPASGCYARWQDLTYLQSAEAFRPGKVMQPVAAGDAAIDGFHFVQPILRATGYGRLPGRFRSATPLARRPRPFRGWGCPWAWRRWRGRRGGIGRCRAGRRARRSRR